VGAVAVAFTVAARNSSGYGPESTSSNVVIPTAPPIPDSFIWGVALAGEDAHEPRNNVLELGDGFVQIIQDGIQTNRPVYSWSVPPKPIAEVDTIIAFLESKDGRIPFFWTPPGSGTAVKVRCPSWKRVRLDETTTRQGVNGTFIRWFGA
jgi:phage-related protein